MTKDEWWGFSKMVDRNGDGKISYDEFGLPGVLGSPRNSVMILINICILSGYFVSFVSVDFMGQCHLGFPDCP